MTNFEKYDYNNDIYCPEIPQSRTQSEFNFVSNANIENYETYFTPKTSNNRASNLLSHRRLGHWRIPGPKYFCPECERSKGQRVSHDAVRPGRQEYAPLRTFAIDYSGSITPLSLRNNRLALVVICDAIKKCFTRPIPEKTAVSEEINKIILGIRQDHSLSLEEKVVWFLRRDNEPVLGSDSMTQVMQSLRVSDAPAPPHNPEANGTVERLMRSLFDCARSLLFGVDARLWDYACEFAGDTWGRTPKKYAKSPQYNNMSPEQVLEQRNGRMSSKCDTNISRRFGCLVYFREQEKKTIGKLNPRYRRGVHLGVCRKSSSYLVGTYAQNDTCRIGFKWTEYSTLDVKFREEFKTQTGQNPIQTEFMLNAIL